MNDFLAIKILIIIAVLIFLLINFFKVKNYYNEFKYFIIINWINIIIINFNFLLMNMALKIIQGIIFCLYLIVKQFF